MSERAAAATPQSEKVDRFRALHERDGIFVMPNPWDRGSALLLEALGFPALGTSSAGFAFSAGRADAARAVSRDEMLAHVAELAAATSLPVSADLEAGYSDTPEGVAETMRLAVSEAGVAGVSIEDATYRPGAPLYDIEEAVERVQAACEGVRASGIPAVVTARAECFLVGHSDALAESIRRLNRYREAGADVLYAPGLASAGEVSAVVRGVDAPVNVVIGMRGMSLPVAELAALGVRRVSLGSTLARVAVGALLEASREIRERGTFDFLDRAIPYAELNARFGER